MTQDPQTGEYGPEDDTDVAPDPKFSDEQIKSFVQANIGNPALIADAAAQAGVSLADLSRATGYSIADVTSYFQNNNVGAQPVQPTPSPDIAPPQRPIEPPPKPVEPPPVQPPPRPVEPPPVQPPVEPPQRPIEQPPVETPKTPDRPLEDLYNTWAQDQVGNPYTKQVVGPRTSYRINADGSSTELDARGDPIYARSDPIKAAETISGLSAVSTAPVENTSSVSASDAILKNTVARLLSDPAALAKVLEEQGATPEDVARATGLPISQVNKWLTEKGISVSGSDYTDSGSSAATSVATEEKPVGALTTIQNNTDTETTPTSSLAAVGAVTDKTASATPVGGLTQAAPVTSTVNMSGKDYVVDNSVVDTLTQQIIAQGTTSKWKGEGFGSPEANAKAMAQHLAASGVKDIKDVGMITVPADVQLTPVTELVWGDTLDSNGYPTQGYVPTVVGYTDDKGNRVDPSKVTKSSGYGGGDAGEAWESYSAPIGTQQVIGNKVTGQPLLSDYAERTGAGGKAFSGTYAGKDNTAFNINFDSKGNPVFYTTGATSNDLAQFMEDIGPLGQIALAVATGGLSIPEQIAAKFAISMLSGQDIGSAITSAVTSYATSFIPGMDFVKDGASYLNGIDSTGILSKAFTGAAVSGTKALLSGQDLGDAILSGAATGGASGAATTLLGNIEGFDSLSKSQQTTIKNLVAGTLTGKPLTDTLLNAVIDTATSEVGKAIDSTVTGLTDSNTLNDSIIGKITGKLDVDSEDEDDLLGTTQTADAAGKDSVTGNPVVNAVTSVLKSTLTGAAKTATKGAITSAITGKKMAAMPSISKQLTGNTLSAIQRAVPTKVDISKLKPTTTAKKAPPKKVNVAQLKAMTPVSGLSAIKKG